MNIFSLNFYFLLLLAYFGSAVQSLTVRDLWLLVLTIPLLPSGETPGSCLGAERSLCQKPGLCTQHSFIALNVSRALPPHTLATPGNHRAFCVSMSLWTFVLCPVTGTSDAWLRNTPFLSLARILLYQHRQLASSFG